VALLALMESLEAWAAVVEERAAWEAGSEEATGCGHDRGGCLRERGRHTGAATEVGTGRSSDISWPPAAGCAPAPADIASHLLLGGGLGGGVGGSGGSGNLEIRSSLSSS
jgi:hypothetical protein